MGVILLSYFEVAGCHEIIPSLFAVRHEKTELPVVRCPPLRDGLAECLLSLSGVNVGDAERTREPKVSKPAG